MTKKKPLKTRGFDSQTLNTIYNKDTTMITTQQILDRLKQQQLTLQVGHSTQRLQSSRTLQHMLNRLRAAQDTGSPGDGEQQCRDVRLSPDELRHQEMLEILKLGFWPLWLLKNQGHWLADGEYMRDGLIDEPSCYYFDTWLMDCVNVGMEIRQGDDVNLSETTTVDTELRFFCYREIPHDLHDSVAEVGVDERYPITGFEQIDEIITAQWPRYILRTWPQIEQAIDGHFAHVRSQPLDLDGKMYLELAELMWDRFNPAFQQKLLRLEFGDEWPAGMKAAALDAKNRLKSKYKTADM